MPRVKCPQGFLCCCYQLQHPHSSLFEGGYTYFSIVMTKRLVFINIFLYVHHHLFKARLIVALSTVKATIQRSKAHLHRSRSPHYTKRVMLHHSPLLPMVVPWLLPSCLLPQVRSLQSPQPTNLGSYTNRERRTQEGCKWKE